MAKKESRRVKTLSSFMKWAEQFDSGQYLFRGVSNENMDFFINYYFLTVEEFKADIGIELPEDIAAILTQK